MTMVSRVFGLLRDIVFARFFGATDGADAFFVAFKIPQFLRRLFAEGAFAQAFVPVLSAYRRDQPIEAVRALINAVCGVLGGSLFLIVGLVVLAAPLVTLLFAPGFVDQPDKLQLTTDLLRITFPYLLLISLTGFAGAILNSYDRFLVPAITPVLLNLSLIGFAVWVSPLMNQPVFALAWAVLFAGCLQLLFQLPFLHRLDLLPAPVWDWQHEGVQRVVTLMLPAIFGVSVSQINLLLDTVLASFLPGGSVSWLYYSDRLAELPLGVFGIAIATVILPVLSRLPEQHSHEHFAAMLDWAMRCIAVVALPATAALIVLGEPILYALFQYGATTAFDVQMASLSLAAYALGLFAFMSIKVLATGFYSRQDMRTPVRIGIIAMIANMALNLVFVAVLHTVWHIGHVGLALATAASAFLNAALLYRGLGRAMQRLLLTPMFWRLLLKIAVAAMLMVTGLVAMQPAAEFWAQAAGLVRVGWVLMLCLAGLSVYVLSLLLLGVRIHHFRDGKLP